jgi:hypothetical protein
MLLSLFVLGIGGITAQATPLTYGTIVTGRIDQSTPRQVYTFDGLRGEYTRIRAKTTSGNLDLVISVLDSSGSLLATRDDSSGAKDPIIEALRIDQNDTYTIVIGRFGYALGSTAGTYELVIERVGVSFESGSALRYGDTIVNKITPQQGEFFYTFTAERGDLITITMRRDSGDLDPLLQVAKVATRQIIAENDDMPDSIDAQIADLLIEEPGVYLIIATRYGGAAGRSAGDFLLTLERADSSGQGVSPQVAIPLPLNTPITGEITPERFEIYYSFSARRDELLTVRMTRLTGSTLDSLLTLTNANLQPLATNDDIVQGNQNAQIAEFRIPSDGTYYVIASRYQGAAGTSIGRYRIELLPLGNVFDRVIEGAGRLVYGATVELTLDATTESAIYAFYGVQADIITASAIRERGALIPRLTLSDESGRVLSSGSEGAGGSVRIDRYVLPRTGLYYLRVERGEADETGEFLITLAQLAN